MHFTHFAALALGWTGLLEAAATPRHRHYPVRRQDNGTNTCLNQDALQAASSRSGQEDGSDGIGAGQSPSAQDSANFINFCSGSTLTDGAQIREGSCNGIPMGKIPSVSNMISAMIVEPQVGQTVNADTTFTVRVQTQGLDAGSFTNPIVTYYAAPQDLNNNGQIIGHCHITIQDLGNSLNPSGSPDPSRFAFFKGINDAGNGQGLLEAEVAGGLAAGFYRVCTMISSSNHQPVLMPVAQRGAQDDCTKFEVVAGGNGGNDGGNDTGVDDGNDNGNNGGNENNNGGGDDNGGGSNGAAVEVVSGNLGGAPPPIEASGNSNRPFLVNGNTFVDEAAAVQRACDIQRNACLDGVNRGQISGSNINDCEQQRIGCRAA